MIRNQRNKRRLIITGRYTLIICWLLFTLLPLYTAFVASLTKYENLGKTFLFPVDFYWQNYVEIFQRVSFTDFLKATIIYAVGTSLVNVLLASLAAYALSRYRFKGKSFYMSMLLVTQIIPQVVIVIPVFVMLNNLGLYDSYIGVIIVIIATSMTFPILLLRGFFDSIPVALEEAAVIDGCSRLRVLTRIIAPLAAPGIATAFALSFFTGWAQYLYPLVLTVSPDKTPLTVGISRLIDNQTPWEMVMTGTLLSCIPAIVIYMSAQKFLIKGLVVGSIK
jgi:ABC-type glycerol-3-phosphate transport system permease component